MLAACSKDDPIYRTIPDVYVQEQASDTLTGLLCFPNPASGNTTVSFWLERQQKLDIRIFNRFGIAVFEKVGYSCSSGYNILYIDLAGWEQGVYIVQVIANKKSYSKQLVKV
jgi:hypothetical protein